MGQIGLDGVPLGWAGGGQPPGTVVSPVGVMLTSGGGVTVVVVLVGDESGPLVVVDVGPVELVGALVVGSVVGVVVVGSVVGVMPDGGGSGDGQTAGQGGQLMLTVVDWRTLPSVAVTVT